MSKRILIIGNNSGGMFHFRGMLIKSLIEQGHRVTVWTPFDTNVDDLRALGAEVIEKSMSRRGMNPLRDYQLYHTYRASLHSLKPDLVITYTIKPNIYGGYACRREGIPYAANITGLGTAFQKKGMLRSLVTFMYRASLKKAHTVFFENETNRNVFTNAGIIRQNQAYRLNGAGVDLEHFSVLPTSNSEEFRFLFIGRVMREKGIDELLAAMERLVKEGENCSLDILGDYEENYKETLERCEAAGWLHYHGFQTEIRSYIGNANCFVLPSWHEGMANTNLECAASGRPIITSDIPGCREAVIDGTSGLLCKAQDAESLYQTMKQMLHMSAENRTSMGLAGRAHMEQVFDKKKVVADTLQRLGLQE